MMIMMMMMMIIELYYCFWHDCFIQKRTRQMNKETKIKMHCTLQAEM